LEKLLTIFLIIKEIYTDNKTLSHLKKVEQPMNEPHQDLHFDENPKYL